MFHMLFECFFITHITEFVKMFAKYFGRKILLVNIMIGIIMGIFVTDTFSQCFVTAIMSILKMNRYGGAGRVGAQAI